jgi:hypothetical protein
MANEINIKLVVDGKEANATLSLTDEQLKQIARQAAKAGEDTTSQFAKIGNVVTGINQGLELAKKGFEVLSKPLEAAGQFEQYESSLKVMLGSTEAAKERLAELVDFAKTTPFELPQVVEAANKLQAIGRYSKENLTDLGDLSAAAGKPMEQALDAYAKLATGQKGIAVDMFRDLLITQQDWMDATGKGITKNGELLATTEEMLGALPEILRKKNFTGMMDEQSKTFNGQLSNLKDSIGQFETEVGNMLLPVAKNLLEVLTPAVSGAKNNIGILITVVETGAAAFVTYQVAVNGATVATKLMEAASIGVKKAIDAIKLAMAANPWGLALAAVAALGVALYNLNEEFGNTLDNQLKNAKAAEEANKQSQKETEKKIEEKEAVKKLGEEYETLNGKLQSGTLNAEERKKAEARLQEILAKIKEQYPDLIKSTGDYSKELINVKTAAGNAKDELVTLHAELTGYQKDMLNLKIATGNIEVAKGFEDVYKEFRTLTIGGSKGLTLGGQEGEKEIKYLESLANDLSSGKKKISEVQNELGAELKKYSQAAANGGDNASYNLEKANKLKALYDKLGELKKSYTQLNAPNTAIPSGTNTNTTTTTTAGGGKEDSFAKNKAKTLGEISRQNEQALEKETALNMGYAALLDARARKQREVSAINEKLNDANNQKELDALNTQRETAQDSIKILDEEIRRKENINKKNLEDTIARAKEEADAEKQLAEMKSAIIDDVKMQMEREMFDKELQTTTINALEDSLFTQEMDREAILGIIKESRNAQEVNLFQAKMERTDEEIALLKQEIAARKESAKQDILAGVQQYDARVSLGEQMKGLVRDRIKQIIAEAVAEQLAKVIAMIPFPFNIIAAPAAGLAVQALISSLLPKFETGGLPKGKNAIVQLNEDGQEFIANARATKENLPALIAMNAGASLADIAARSAADQNIEIAARPAGVFLDANTFAHPEIGLNAGIFKAAESLRDIKIPSIQGPSAAPSTEGFKMLRDGLGSDLETLGDRLEAVERVINIRELHEEYTKFKNKENFIGN